MPYSGQSSRSTSSSSSGKVPLQCQSDSKQRSTYDSYEYTPTFNDPRYASSSSSSSSKSGWSSKSDKIPPSISRGTPSRDEARSKTNDSRYYATSFQDARQPEKKPLSFQKNNDTRYYPDSSYYR